MHQNHEPVDSEFLLRLCHDMRAAVRPVRTQTELLLRSRETSTALDIEQRAAFILDGASKMEAILDGLVALSLALAIDAHSFQPMPADILLRTALARLAQELTRNSANVSYDKLPVVNGVPDRLIQLFELLVGNALRFRGPTPPLIRIAAEKQPDAWIFSVRDNGPGLEADRLESVFQPFQKLHGPDRAGAGLGLTICRVIVERHGGRIWAESDPSGASFLFTLPA